jgi:hypothetical protein
MELDIIIINDELKRKEKKKKKQSWNDFIEMPLEDPKYIKKNIDIDKPKRGVIDILLYSSTNSYTFKNF